MRTGTKNIAAACAMAFLGKCLWKYQKIKVISTSKLIATGDINQSNPRDNPDSNHLESIEVRMETTAR